jgi:hypothetical protein
MSFLESVRDRLREEHEERIDMITKKMIRVAEFQLQLKTSDMTAKEIVQKVDPSAPIPQPLEGGDSKGPLYQCLLRKEKLETFLHFCEENLTNFKLYSGPTSFDLEERLYKANGYVQWQMGNSPTVTFQQ